MPAVSVVLPAFNAQPTLPAAVASLRAQRFADWELVIVDDGSTDGTRAVATAGASSDPRIRVVAQAHAGIVRALNTGLAAARGALIARMDADDEAHPDRLGEQVAALEGDPGLGLVGCLVEYGGDRDTNAGYALHVDWVNSLVTPEAIALNRFVESPLAHPSVVFRRELLDRHGGYREGAFPEDYELWLRWLDAGVRMQKVPRALLRWNDPPSRLSRAEPRYGPENFFRVKAAWIARELGRVARGRGVWIWGAGRPTRKRAAPLGDAGVTIAGYVDVDARKIGRPIAGRPVVGANDLPSPGQAFVLGYVGSRGARELIRDALQRRGYVEGESFLMCA